MNSSYNNQAADLTDVRFCITLVRTVSLSVTRGRKKNRCSRVLISERLPAKRGVVVVAVVVGVVSIDNRSQQRMTEPSQSASSLLVLTIITDWTGNRGNVRSG